MIFKVLYDFKRPFWQSFGRVLFIECDTADTADTAGRAAAQALEPDAELTRVDVTPAMEAQRERHDAKVAAYRQWADNTRLGIPNRRGSL